MYLSFKKIYRLYSSMRANALYVLSTLFLRNSDFVDGEESCMVQGAPDSTYICVPDSHLGETRVSQRPPSLFLFSTLKRRCTPLKNSLNFNEK